MTDLQSATQVYAIQQYSFYRCPDLCEHITENLEDWKDWVRTPGRITSSLVDTNVGMSSLSGCSQQHSIEWSSVCEVFQHVPTFCWEPCLIELGLRSDLDSTRAQVAHEQPHLQPMPLNYEELSSLKGAETPGEVPSPSNKHGYVEHGPERKTFFLYEQTVFHFVPGSVSPS